LRLRKQTLSPALCEEVSPGAVYASASFAARRHCWSRRAPSVVIRQTLFYRLQGGKVTHSWHNTNSSEVWLQFAGIDAQERLRGGGPPLALAREDPTFVASLRLAFREWGLSPRLQGVAKLMVAGRTDKEIAHEATGRSTGYLRMPTPHSMAKIERTVRLHEILPDYRGPMVNFDLDASGHLLGIEVINTEDDDDELMS
jgi:hypothetical protein